MIEYENLLLQYLKPWAFTAFSTGVQVHAKENVQYVRDLLDSHGFAYIRVTGEPAREKCPVQLS